MLPEYEKRVQYFPVHKQKQPNYQFNILYIITIRINNSSASVSNMLQQVPRVSP